MASFRPIAPAEPATLYAAACNPPRRAKRTRADSASTPSDEEDEEEEDDHPLPPPKRRGRRPGTLSRAAREAQRKINHSLIEKARRTKINDALATLRELVPPDAHPADDSDGDDLERKNKPKPKAPGEKEFKLEILVRTVAYLQDLTARVKQLEQSGCPRCSEPISLARTEDPPEPASPARLPSIASWLPPDAPSQSPTTAPRSSQLPTPPASAVCAPATSGYQVPPVLTLPSPSTFLPAMQPRFSGFSSRAKPSSPVSSPVYTAEDETAASLLLRISTTSPRTALKAGPVRPAEADKLAGYALTPSRLLGLSAER